MGLNLVGIVFFLVYSVYLRNKLSRVQNELDKCIYTASDFAVICRGLADDCDQDCLKMMIEEKFSMFGLKVAYVNYTYDVEDFIKATQRLNILQRKLAIWTKYKNRIMNKNNYTKE